MTPTRNRPAMFLGLLLAGLLALIAVNLGAFEQAGPAGLTENPCPAEYGSKTEIVIAALSGRAGRQAARDWGNLCRYRRANAEVMAGPPVRAVLIGDSITEQWQAAMPDMFSTGLVNRGISGQIAPQVALRFYPDAVALRPRAIHLMIGVNDLAGFYGPTSADNLRNTFRAMADMAGSNRIPVVLASMTPVRRDGDLPRQDAFRQIAGFNRWLAAFAAERGIIYADYHSVLSEPSGELKAGFTSDGVHLNKAGYAAIRPILDAALERAVSARPGPEAIGNKPQDRPNG